MPHTCISTGARNTHLVFVDKPDRCSMQGSSDAMNWLLCRGGHAANMLSGVNKKTSS
jgi:hypothetical protein